MAGAIVIERNVNQANTDTTLIRDVSEDMLLLEPDQSPLLVLTNKNKRKAPATAPKFEWFEKAEVPVWDVLNSTVDYSTTAQTLLVTDITLYAVGDILAFPVVATSSALEELCLVGTVGTNNVVVTRAFGGTTAAAIGSTQSVRVLASATVEAAGVPTVRSAAAVAKASYCQIFRTPLDVSRTMMATEAYASPQGKRIELQMEALKRHKQEIESAGLWGGGSQTLASGGSTWSTQGIKQTIATFVTNAATTFTISKFNDFCETAFRYGSTEKLLLAAPKVISAMNFFSQNKLLTANGDKVFGVAIQRVLGNGFGEVMLANNFRMNDQPSAKDGFQRDGYMVDLPSIRYRFLNGNGNSQDTKLFENVKVDGSARVIDEYYSQVGWEVRFEKKHARLYNVQQYA